MAELRGPAHFASLIQVFTDWLADQVDRILAKVMEQMQLLQVDLQPGPEVLAFVAKANALVPLQEMWHYLLLYLSVASVVLGIKWARNLIPGLR